ncbi:hypothetical protein IVB16_31135 [Bradyrhizobium sp. 183]|uniref:hypothetical protein n=1 Tax=unclassified Bradyrhizobium TaxID=2631580 RepID=UPI001FFFA44A|nr:MULTISPECIES: hypothetical protein [unclassified Bradyrhizobium]UPJ79218.1 hypothetical protein IVB17_31135 [Bradyrhizobium sp. 184]UPJ87011.1 hypothetical protein IVB16_31135 [Bradyrhizobium sp. 183]UPK20639.1 hypothetical protein IVA73_06535 [Bradyrhizobium sp. 131]
MHALLLEHVTGQACSHIVAVGRLERIPGLKHTGKDNHAWLFNGETIFCLASGPSLMAEICQRVRGRRSIAINLSAVLAPWASVLFFTDSGWYEPRRQLVANWDGLAIALGATRVGPGALPRRVQGLGPRFRDLLARIRSGLCRLGRGRTRRRRRSHQRD